MSLPAAISADELGLRLRQQELVANFGLFALDNGSVQALVDEACRTSALGLGTRLAKVLQHRGGDEGFLVIAGIGWHAGVVGHSTLGSGLDSPAGFAMHTAQPVLSNHLARERRFRVPALLAEHGVRSALNVVIGQAGQPPFGVLEVDSTRRDEFIQADKAFLQSLANVLGAGLARAKSEVAKDALLADKDLLMREVHHRVANSLQLVRTMLGLQGRGASDEARAELEIASGRILSIAAVHRRLYQGGSVAEADAAGYVQALLDDMRDMLDAATEGRVIELDAPIIMLAPDRLTSLGLVVAELVTNAIKYGLGRIGVSVSQSGGNLEVVVEDEGTFIGADPANGRPKGLGTRLITSLAKGDAKRAIRFDPSAGHTRVIVTLAP